MHFLLTFCGRHAAVGEGQFHIFVNIQIADEVKCLEDEADFAVADARALRQLEALYRLTVQNVSAGGGRIKQAQDRQQSGFATAGRARNRDILASLDIDVNPGKSVGFDFVCDEYLGHAVQVDQWLCCAHAAKSLPVFC